MKADAEGRLRSHIVEERVGAEGKDRYPRGAYCAIEWDDPKSIVIERAEYAAWWAGLDLLAHELSGKLASIAVLPPAAAQRPWAARRTRRSRSGSSTTPSSRKRLREQRIDQVVDNPCPIAGRAAHASRRRKRQRNPRRPNSAHTLIG